MRYGYMIVQVIDLAAYPSFPCHYFSDKKTFKIILVVEVSLTTFPTKIVFNLQIVRYSPLNFFVKTLYKLWSEEEKITMRQCPGKHQRKKLQQN